MARIRTIKPEFFRHEVLQDIEAKHPGSYSMLVFAGLWGHCDSKGRFEWKARQLKLDILPFLQFDMSETLELLADFGMIVGYSVDGKDYGEIPSFSRHQRLTGKEVTDGEKHPRNTGEAMGKHQGNNGERLDSQEGKGKERSKPLFAEANEKQQGSIGETPEKQQGSIEPEYSEPFLRFWSAYPTRRRTAKPKCFAVWQRQRLDAKIAVVMTDVSAKCATDDWRKEGGEYVPAPLTYLNQGRWADSEPGELAATPEAAKAKAGGDPYKVVGMEWVVELRGRMGGPMFANTPGEQRMVEQQAKTLGWTP